MVKVSNTHYYQHHNILETFPMIICIKFLTQVECHTASEYQKNVLHVQDIEQNAWSWES